MLPNQCSETPTHWKNAEVPRVLPCMQRPHIGKPSVSLIARRPFQQPHCVSSDDIVRAAEEERKRKTEEKRQVGLTMGELVHWYSVGCGNFSPTGAALSFSRATTRQCLVVACRRQELPKLKSRRRTTSSSSPSIRGCLCRPALSLAQVCTCRCLLLVA